MNIPVAISKLRSLITENNEPIDGITIGRAKQACDLSYEIYKNTIGLDTDYRTVVFDLTQLVTSKDYRSSLSIINALIGEEPTVIIPVGEPTGIPIITPNSKVKGNSKAERKFKATPLQPGPPKPIKLFSTKENASATDRKLMEIRQNGHNPRRKNQKKGGTLPDDTTNQ